jgi:hypothetical protein
MKESGVTACIGRRISVTFGVVMAVASPALPSSLDVLLRPARTLELIGATTRRTPQR